MKRALCMADVGLSGIDRRPASDDGGRPAKDRKEGADLKAVKRAAEAALKASAKASEADWSAKASVGPSPRGPVVRITWTCSGTGGETEGEAEFCLQDLVRRSAF